MSLPVQTINPGELYVSNEPCIIKTLLGSCVSVCLYNHSEQYGGMNHFMLPDTTAGNPRSDTDYRFGDVSTRRLISQMLEYDSNRDHLTVKLFGGGRVISSLSRSDIGQKNINSARNILASYDLSVSKEYVGMDNGIKLRFNTRTGTVKLRDITGSDDRKSVIKENDSQISSILSGDDSESGINLMDQD